MLKRLYIDNYRCFTNFEWQPGDRMFVAGRSGSGKSTALEVIWKLRALLVCGEPVRELFTPKTLTSYDERNEQTFEITIGTDGQDFHYRLVVAFDEFRKNPCISHECLKTEGGTVYEFMRGKSHFFKDDGSPGKATRTSGARSTLSQVEASPAYQRLAAFRARMGRVYVFAIEPPHMSALSTIATADPDPGLRNIASWIRHLQAEDSRFSGQLNERMKTLFPSFSHYSLKRENNSTDRTLWLHFSPREDRDTHYALSFEQLSDGERTLFALHIVLIALLEYDSTLCFDEPGNFLSPERIGDCVDEIQRYEFYEQYQFLIATQRPEILALATAHDKMVLFEREDSAPVRWRSLNGSEAAVLRAPERTLPESMAPERPRPKSTPELN